MKKLLEQVEAEDLDRATNTQKFETKLDEIMKRYKIDNASLKAEIAYLHRDLREWMINRLGILLANYVLSRSYIYVVEAIEMKFLGSLIRICCSLVINRASGDSFDLP